jgi:hypothetical protein
MGLQLEIETRGEKIAYNLHFRKNTFAILICCVLFSSFERDYILAHDTTDKS